MSQRRLALLALCLLCGAGLLANLLTAADVADKPTEKNLQSASWTQWRGPGRNNMSAETGLLKDWNAAAPKLLWTAEGVGDGYAGVSVLKGKIYTTGNVGGGQSVICLNLDGKVLWTSKFTENNPRHDYDGSRCTPTLDGDLLYVVASSGNITCLKQDDGSLVWTKDFAKDFGGKMMSGWGYSESPLVDGDLVICTPGGKDAILVALNKKDGSVAWKSAADLSPSKGKDGAGYSSIVISEGAGVKQYVQLVGRGVIGVRASDGKFLWEYNAVANGVANIPTPIVSGDYVFASTGYGTGSALIKLEKDGDGVKAVEQYFLNADKLQNHHGGMILKDGHIYCGHKHNEGFPICVEMATGKTVWELDKRPVGKGSAAITYADGKLIFRYQNGIVALIDATTTGYNLLGSFKPDYVGDKPCWAHPVVVGGRMYLRDQNKLMCYDLTAQ